MPPPHANSPTATSSADHAPPAPKGTTSVLLLIVFLDLLGIGIIAPLSPYVVERFDASATAVGYLTLTYSAFQFLATPVLGALSDRLGRRPVLLWSVLGSSLGYVLFALSGSLELLLLSRAIDGITGGNISTAQAALADVTPPAQRSKAYGMIGAAFGLGFFLGPALSAAIVELAAAWAESAPDLASSAPASRPDWVTLAPIWFAAGLSLLTAGIVYFRLPESLPPEKRSSSRVHPRDINPFGVLAKALSVPGIAALLGASFLIALAHAELRTSFGVLMRDKFDYTESQAGRIFAFMGLVAILVQGGLVRAVVPRFGERATLIAALPIAVLGWTLIPLVPEARLVYLAISLCGLGMGLSGPAIMGVLSRSAPAVAQGRVMGASQAVNSLGLVVGPLMAGVLYDASGKGWPFLHGAIAILGALSILASHVAPKAPRS